MLIRIPQPIRKGEHVMQLEQRLKELGLELPPPPPAAGNYVAGVVTGNLLFMSGCGPRRPDGYLKGKVGAELSIEQGYEAARQTGLNMLANIRAVLGSLDRVERVVKTLGMVNCTPDFGDSPKVINGFSDLFVELLGEERGRGARSAVGMMALPSQIPVEVEMVLEISSG
jgi:enamine deaminase RidA (YjgF/YER057c/UK114 family)